MIKFTKVMVVVNVLIVVHMITGCEDGPKETRVQSSALHSYPVDMINECEYLRCRTYGSNYVLTHKGDCKNPIHNYARKEDEDEQEVKKNREDRRK